MRTSLEGNVGGEYSEEKKLMRSCEGRRVMAKRWIVPLEVIQAVR